MVFAAVPWSEAFAETPSAKCYSLVLSEWQLAEKIVPFASSFDPQSANVSGPDLVPPEGDDFAPPARVTFTGTRVKNSDGGWFVIRAAQGARPSVHEFAQWRSVAKGQIEVQWSTGFAGFGGVLTARLGGYVGTVETFRDTPAPRFKADLRVAQCAAPQKP